MPIILIVLLALIIAQVGFWDTLGALFGAVVMIILFLLLVAAVFAVAGYVLVRRYRRRF